MSENKDRTSFELQVGDVRIAVEGTESYVDVIIKKIGDIVASVQSALKAIRPSDRGGARQGGLPPLGGQDSTAAGEEQWEKAIAEKASISVEQVRRVFVNRGGQIVVYGWDVSASSKDPRKQAELNRVVSILHMFANDMVTSTRTYSLDTLKAAFRELRLSFSSRDQDLRPSLKRDNYIREDSSGMFELTPLGEVRAKELLKEAAQLKEPAQK